MSKPGPLIAGIEAGGTKFVLAVGPSPTHITARHTIATTTPEETLAQAAQWFRDQGTITSLGIASFGPVDLDQASPTWGHITNTPKPRWSGCNIAGYFADRMQVPLGFDTDVNAAALAEYLYGAGKGSRSIAYITIGTGIGGGLIIDGKPVHGIAHPELGHIVPRRHGDDREFAGICPHHSDCLEGLASGPAIKARWGSSLSDLPQDHAAHAIVAEYIAQLCHALFAIAAVETIVLGGGVMKTAGLLQRVKDRAASLDRGYLPGKARHCIVAPALGDNSGITGALSLAQ